MLGYEIRLEPVDQALEGREVFRVRLARASGPTP